MWHLVDNDGVVLCSDKESFPTAAKRAAPAGGGAPPTKRARAAPPTTEPPPSSIDPPYQRFLQTEGKRQMALFKKKNPKADNQAALVMGTRTPQPLVLSGSQHVLKPARSPRSLISRDADREIAVW